MEIQIKKPSHRELLQKRFLLNQKRLTFTFAASLIFLLCLGLLYLHQSNQLVALVNKKEKLLRQKQEYERIKDSFIQEEVHLSSLQRIEFLAREKLGMIVPGRDNRIIIEKP